MIVTGAAALILLINEEIHIQYHLKLKYFVPSCDILLVFDSQIGKLLIRCLHNCLSLPRRPRNNKIFSLRPILPGKGVMPFVPYNFFFTGDNCLGVHNVPPYL